MLHKNKTIYIACYPLTNLLSVILDVITSFNTRHLEVLCFLEALLVKHLCGRQYKIISVILYSGADPGFFAGGGVNDGRVQRAPNFGARADGGLGVDKHQIKVHSVHRIFRAIFFFLL